ncbi:MAG TPA: bifunctional hydroxymethylpyrimidine kinase/phosphomethylpyrimidine kinase [Candidatus Polarisedimenticolaceae bacterium]|nr:bifunctional hydroxymethylpyrimidine kinase/phosphomethylpyrimidine kinase [Candidatus Polarisedimenticolaceae bacterium]
MLAIAGSDSSAGAGIQADLKAIEASGGYAATVVTAVTAQNTRGVRRVDRIAPDAVGAQLDALFDDLEIAAVKTGMLVGAETVCVVADVLEVRRPPIVVCDPVAMSSSGAELLDETGLDALRRRIFPLATLITPNAGEAARLSGVAVDRVADAERAGRVLRDAGARAVLVTGGHLAEAPATDVLVDASGTTIFAGRFVERPDTHGTGCVLASAIATGLARGLALATAIRRAKRLTATAIRRGLSIGSGARLIDALYRLHGRGTEGR